MTLLGLFNYHMARRLGFAVSHTVAGDRWRPWWRGDHRRGTWRIVAPRVWYT